jgi:3-oxoadipate enol-lactonase
MIINVNNTDLAVSIAGDKIPFIWAHGLTGSMSVEDSSGLFDWQGCAKIAKVIRYDARGHGISGGTLVPADYHWSNLASDMLCIADQLGIGNFIAGGQSMGCATSLYAAVAAPERISGLVLINPPTAWETRAAQSAIYEIGVAVAEKEGTRALADLLRQRPLSPEWLWQTIPGALDSRLNSLQARDSQIVASVLLGAVLCNLPPREELKKLEMPTLILAWANDAQHPLETAEELKSLLPSSRLFVADTVTKVRTWPGLILDFIKELSR